MDSFIYMNRQAPIYMASHTVKRYTRTSRGLMWAVLTGAIVIDVATSTGSHLAVGRWTCDAGHGR